MLSGSTVGASGGGGGSWQLALANCAARPLGKRHSAFPLVQANSTFGGGLCSRRSPGRAQYRGQCQTGVGVIHRHVGALGHADSGLGDPPCPVVIPAAR